MPSGSTCGKQPEPNPPRDRFDAWAAPTIAAGGCWPPGRLVLLRHPVRAPRPGSPRPRRSCRWPTWNRRGRNRSSCSSSVRRRRRSSWSTSQPAPPAGDPAFEAAVRTETAAVATRPTFVRSRASVWPRARSPPTGASPTTSSCGRHRPGTARRRAPPNPSGTGRYGVSACRLTSRAPRSTATSRPSPKWDLRRAELVSLLPPRGGVRARLVLAR